MATQLFLLSVAADTHLGTNNANLRGTSVGWANLALGTARGSGITVSLNTPTVTGATVGVEVEANGFPGPTCDYISPPVSADVTISGAVTGNLWASENNMSANVAINFVVDVIRATDNAIVEIVRSDRVTELAVTTRAVNNFTATPGAGVTVNRGDRIRVRIFGDDAGTMGSGFTFQISHNGTTAAADGDSYISFTETFAFESAPAGSVLYLTDAASDVSTASVDREAWTSRGAGVATDVTNTAAGWTAPIQVTDTAGGTVVDWFTKQLSAFTLTGMAVANLRALHSNTLANASLKLEIARVDTDGTSPTVWGSWCIAPTSADGGELTVSEVARTANVSGDDLAFTDGQRIRIRLYIDDYCAAAMGASQTVTLFYNGTSAAASGDTYVTLPQTVTEFTAAATGLPLAGMALGRGY